MPCFRCGRVQEDPPQGKPSPWARAVVSGEQVLVCPVCQREHPDWRDVAERCPRCGCDKITLKLGYRVCPKCGNSWE
ncbi:MAG: hypothetical protein ACXVQY_06425 [Actinomycetota bacterium]